LRRTILRDLSKIGNKISEYRKKVLRGRQVSREKGKRS